MNTAIKEKINATKAVSAYLDWFNNFLTLPCFASHYGITEKHARDLIKIGREKHNAISMVKLKPKP